LFVTTSARSAAISELSVALAPRSNTGTEQTSRSPVTPAPRRKTITFIGSALSVMATHSSFIRVGVVPDPGEVWPGLVTPTLG
jgi:hypothetical protein